MTDHDYEVPHYRKCSVQFVLTIRFLTKQVLKCIMLTVTVHKSRCFPFFLFLLRFIQGAEADTPYVFYHWEYIDIFNYFSHHMVTIPPAMWTNAAHKHGVLSLGQCSP